MNELDRQPYFAKGKDKKVTLDTKKNKIVAEFKKPQYRMTELQMKGAYYLRKILHLLFPNNIPDIYLSATKPPRMEAEFVSLDEKHLELQKLRNKNFKNDPVTASEVVRSQNLVGEINQDPKVVNLKEQLNGVLSMYDSGGANFARNTKTGEAVFIENDIIPWYIDNLGNVNRAYKKEELLKKLSEIEPVKRQKALSYLNRLEELEQQEQEGIPTNYGYIS